MIVESAKHVAHSVLISIFLFSLLLSSALIYSRTALCCPQIWLHSHKLALHLHLLSSDRTDSVSRVIFNVASLRRVGGSSSSWF